MKKTTVKIRAYPADAKALEHWAWVETLRTNRRVTTADAVTYAVKWITKGNHK